MYLAKRTRSRAAHHIAGQSGRLRKIYASFHTARMAIATVTQHFEPNSGSVYLDRI
jgi:hypothetical protein